MSWLFRMGDGRERRRSQRTSLNIAAQVRQNWNTFNGFLVNISPTGAAVELISQEPLTGHIEIELAAGDQPVQFVGRVIHSHRSDDTGCYRYGVSFSGDKGLIEQQVSKLLDVHAATSRTVTS